MSAVSDHLLDDILAWFNELENDLSGISAAIFNIVIGKIPDSKINSVYALADAWEDAAIRLAEIQGEVDGLARPILEGWQGDAAATQYAEQWVAYQQALGGGVESLSGMAEAVRKFGLQIELLKFMVALNLLILAIQIILAIVMAFFSGGLSLAAVWGLIRATGTTIASLAARAVTAIANISLRAALRALPKILPRALPTATRLGAPALTRTALPTLARTQLPNLVRTQLPNLVRTQLPNLVRTQLPNLLRTALPTVGRGAMNVIRNVPNHLARNFLPKNVIARVVANRMATRWMRGMASRRMLRGLGRHAAARGLTQSALVSARNALAWQIEQQLLRKFGTNVAANFVERGAANAVARMAESGIARQITSQTLGQQAVRMSAQVSFGRELAKYMIPRVAFGTAFMGGGNLAGQLMQIAEGHRTSVDWREVGLYTGQGALFGAALWGGALSQGVGGGLAGGAWAIGVETYDYFKSEDPERRRFDWGEVAYQAGHGAASGFAFGLVDQVQMSRINLPSRIGQEVGAMPHPRAERPVLMVRDTNSGTRLMLDGQSGALVERPGRPLLWLDRRGGVVDTSQMGFRPDAGDPGPVRPEGAADQPRVVVGEVVPSDGPPPGRPPGGPDGPVPRQPTPGEPSPPAPQRPESNLPARPEPVRAADPPEPPARALTSASTPDAPSQGRPAMLDQPPPDRAPPVSERGVAPDRASLSERGVAPERGSLAERALDHGSPAERGPVTERGPAGEHGSPSERSLATPERAASERTGSSQERPHEPTGQPHAGPERMPGDRTPGTDQPSSEPGPLSRERGGQEPPSERPVAPESLAPRERSPAGPDGPPLPEPRTPDGQRPEAPLTQREPELMMRSAGAEDGEPPSPRSVEQGTVRMEEHPDYPTVLRELEERGFTVLPTSGDPHVWVRHVVDAQGNVLRVERELHARPGMRFLDLEHELGHARQVTDPRRYPPDRYPHGSLPDEYVRETPEGQRTKPKLHGPKIKSYQIAVHEYHVRLEEYLRLAERGVDPAILQEHARGVDEWRERYRDEIGRGRRSENRPGWVTDHFPDLTDLQRRVAEVRAGESPTGVPPAAPPPRGEAGEGMYKRSGELTDSGGPDPAGGEAAGREGQRRPSRGRFRFLRFWQSDEQPQAGVLPAGEQPHRSPPADLDDGWFAPPRDGLSVPVIGADQVSLQRVTPTEPPAPRQVRPDWVRGTLENPATPPQQRHLVQQHLARPEGQERYVPRSQEEIDQTLAQFRAEAGEAVQPPPPAHPPTADQPSRPHTAGQPAHPLAPDQYAPSSDPGQPSHPGTEPSSHSPEPGEPFHTEPGGGTGDRPLTPNEYWSDPPWQREQRRPSLDELIPSSEFEADNWAGAVRAEFARQFNGREFAGMKLRLDPDDAISVYKNSVTARIQIVDPELGPVGRTVRTFSRDHDGSLYVEHNSIRLDKSAQGRGFASAWNRYLEEWYEYSGVDRITIRASGSAGGFVWAWDGYDWAPNTEHSAKAAFRRLRIEMGAIRDALEQLDRWRDGDHSVDLEPLRQRYRIDDPDTLATELRRQYDDAVRLLDRAARHKFGSDEYPIPYEVAATGWNGQHGREATWIGKRALLGTDWQGVKPISDAGPQFPRPVLADVGSAHPGHPGDPHGSQAPKWINAEQMPGFPGHGGPKEPNANLLAAHDAARYLASQQPDLPGSGYQLRWVSDPTHGDLLVAEAPGRRLPAVALRFTAAEVPEGRVAFTEPTTARTADGVPIFQTTISDSIPVADRELVTRRAVGHEVGELLEELRPRSFAERWQALTGKASGRPFDPHEVGMLTELRLELSDGPGPDPAARSARDQRIGHLLDRLGASYRLDQITSYLESFGHHADLDEARRLAEPDAPWRADALAARRAEGLSAVGHALIRLSADDVGLFAHGQVLPDGATARVGVPTPGGRGVATVDVPVGDLIERLAQSTSVGERLRAEAVTGIAARLAELSGGQLGQTWGKGPDLAAARALVKVLDTVPAEQAPEYRQALRTVLDRLSADELAALRDGPSPETLRRDLLDRQVTAVWGETVTALTGEAPGRVAAGAGWRPDGGLSLTGHDGQVRQVPTATVERIQGWLRGRILDGMDLPTLRAESAAVLAAELSPYSGAPGRSPVVQVFGALGELWSAPDQPAAVRAATEAVAGELLAAHELRSADIEALPPPARRLVETAPPVPRSANPVDPYAPLRTTRSGELAAEVDRLVQELGSGSAADRADRLAAVAEPVSRITDTLDSAAAQLDRRSEALMDSALSRERDAVDKVEQARRERNQPDAWAEERYRTALVEAEQDRVVADRHLNRAAAYEHAAGLARAAQAEYVKLADELAALAAEPDAQWRSRLPRVVDRAAAAERAYQDYAAAMEPVRPVALDNAVPVRRLPYLNALATRVNTMLAGHGIDHRVRPEDLQRDLVSMWRWAAGEDGAVVKVADGAAELRVRFRHRDAVEVVDPPETGAELALAQLPQFPQGSRVRGAVMNRIFGLDVASDLTPWVNKAGELLPDVDLPVLKQALPVFRDVLRHAVLKFNLRYGPRWSLGGEGAEFALPGGVFAVKGDLPLYDVDGVWEVRVRPTGKDVDWSPPALLDRGGEGDRAGLQALVPHSYAEPPPENPVTIDRPLTDRFPEHAVTMSGTDRLRDTTLRLFERAGGQVNEPVRQAVQTLIQEEFPARLDQAINNPGGWHRDIRVDGQPVAIVKIKTTVVRESVQMEGGPSNLAPLEKLRVGFAQASGSTTVSHARGGGIEPGVQLMPGPAKDVPQVSLTRPLSRGSSVNEGFGVARVAIHPNVQRFNGYTQGYRMTVLHEIAVEVFDGTRERDTESGTALFRLAEPEAYRYGLPVDPAALRRDEHNAVIRDEHGRELLRDDPLPGAPPGRAGRFPEWLGPGGIGGAGMANVGQMTGVDAVREQLERRLRADGWLPEIDEEGFPILSSSKVVRVGQLDNLRKIAEVNASRLESDYDQAVQQGIVLDLVRHRVNHAPEHLTLRVRIHQDTPVILGHTRSEAVVNLDIGREVMTRSGGEAQERSKGYALGGGYGIEGGGAISRPSKVTSGWQVSEAVHQGTLVESDGPTAIFRVPQLVEVRKIAAGGEHGSLLAGGDLEGVGRGEARVVLPADLLPEARPDGVLPEAKPAQPPASRPGTPIADRVLYELKVAHLDASGLPGAVRVVLPESAKPGSPGYVHTAAFVSVRNLIAAPVWLHGEYRTDHAVDPRGVMPLRSSLEVSGELRELKFLTAARLVTADINFSMDAHSVTVGQEQTRAANVGGGSALGGGGYAYAAPSGGSVSSELIKGRERLDPVGGVHYVFWGAADLTVTGTEHHSLALGGRKTHEEPLPRVQLVGVMPEARALALYADGDLPLPLAQVEDALTRHRNGHLKLDHHIADRITQRYQADFALAKQAQAASPATPLAVPEGEAARPPATTEPAAKPPAPRDDPDAANWRLPENLRDSLGQAGAEPVYLVDPEGRPLAPVALLNEVLRHVERVSPGAVERLPGLHQGLTGQFAGRSWSGKLDRMLGVDGWEFEVAVPAGRYGVEKVTITLTARFLEVDTGSGPAEGRLVGRSPETGSILQDYGYEQSTTNQYRGSSHGVSGAVNDAAIGRFDAPDVEAVVDRSRTGAGWVSTQTTRVQRLSSFDGVDRFERPIEITVKVTSRFDSPVQELPVRAYRRLTGGNRTESVDMITGAVVQRVPDGLLRQVDPGETGGESATAPTTPVTRLPDRYAVESIHLGNLSSVVRDLLAHNGLLGGDGVAQHRVTINRALSTMGGSAGLEWMHTRGGHPLVELPRPGHPDQMVRVFVEAEPTGQRVVTPSRPNVQLGHDTRSQHLIGERDAQDRLLPATRNIGDEQPLLGGAKAGYSKGASASESSQLVIGDRDEHKAWQMGSASTVAVDLNLRIHAVTSTVLPGGIHHVEAVRSASAPVQARAYLTVYDSELDGPATRPGTGQWRVDGPSSPAGPARPAWLPGWLGRSRTTPTVALDAVLSDLAGRQGFAAADAPSAVADRLAADLGKRWRSAPLIHLDGAGVARYGVDPLAVAAEAASRRGGEVLIDVHGADGTLWPYRVLPDGAVHPAFPDGGYAAARAGLPHDLAARADQAGLDLRPVYQESVRTGRPFADVVTEAVASAGSGGGRHLSPTPGAAISGVRVLMGDGTTKPISEIAPGEQVWAADPGTGAEGPRAVTAVSMRNDTVVDLVLDDGAVVTIAEDRLVWNETDQQWQMPTDLDPGDMLVTDSGRVVAVAGVDPSRTRSEMAYNLAVADLHTYYVIAGDTPILVHNHVPAPRDLAGFPNAKRVRPKTPVQGGRGMRQRWEDGKYIYEWDSRHGEVEKYDKRGKHLGSFDPETGEELKGPVPGRRTNK